MENGEKVIKATGHIGIIRLQNGVSIEILPKIPVENDDEDVKRQILFRMLSSLFGIPYSEEISGASEADDNTFLEYFISVYARECMKIIKSGMLSGYQSVEENTSSVQGTVLFAENNRRNLVHRERLYVRHDVFTNDRAENRLMKTAANIMMKFSKSHQNTQNLKKVLVYLDEVKFSRDPEADFAKCINTRNAKKYNTVLNICTLFLKKRRNTELSGRYVTYSMIFPMEDVFRAYCTMLVKENCTGRTVRTGNSGKYLCENQQLFDLGHDLVVYNEKNRPEYVIMTRWQRIESENDIKECDINALVVSAKRLGCNKAVLLYPGGLKGSKLPNNGRFTLECDGEIELQIRNVQPTQFEGGSILY